MSEAEDPSQTGQVVIVSREVKPIKHRHWATRFFSWLVPVEQRKKRQAEEQRLTA